ncbi:MAG: NADH-quinone oxidoreductase subunit NuoE [Hyphomicrobiales bacterium]|nr:NADH-quinone oxidoreductase subunit NuoE [Hyphomicrobiales bacterium]
MAVRRLAENQPESFAFTPENAAWCATQIAKYPSGRQASAVIPLLWRAQAQNAYWLPRAAIEAVAGMLAMPYIRVLEIATFYSMFNLAPVGRAHVQLCGTTPCMLRGANGLRSALVERIGPAGSTTPDGALSWVEVECLGACCNAPMVQINDDYYEDLTPASLGGLLDDLAAGRAVKKGSQTGRTSSEPEPGKGTTLTDPALYDGSRVGAWRKRFEEAEAKAAEAAAAAANDKAK